MDEKRLIVQMGSDERRRTRGDDVVVLVESDLEQALDLVGRMMEKKEICFARDLEVVSPEEIVERWKDSNSSKKTVVKFV